VIEGLMTFRLDESDIKPSDYLPFTPDAPQDCYVIGIVSRQDESATFYASRLLEHAMNYLTELVERGICLHMLYTVGTTTEGDHLARKLGVEEVRRGQGPLDDDRVAFALDLAANPPKSALIGRYQAAVKNQQRRARRHQRTSA
jgi:hypothetical protein